MSASVTSTSSAAQKEALAKGPGRGVSAPASAATLRILADKASMPVGAPSVATTNYIRFMRVPAGATVYPPLVSLTTNHPGGFGGKLQFVPIDGIGATQEITGFYVNYEDTEGLTILNTGADKVILKDSWVQFVPNGNITIATTAKDIRIRLPYGQTY